MVLLELKKILDNYKRAEEFDLKSVVKKITGKERKEIESDEDARGIKRIVDDMFAISKYQLGDSHKHFNLVDHVDTYAYFNRYKKEKLNHIRDYIVNHEGRKRTEKRVKYFDADWKTDEEDLRNFLITNEAIKILNKTLNLPEYKDIDKELHYKAFKEYCKRFWESDDEEWHVPPKDKEQFLENIVGNDPEKIRILKDTFLDISPDYPHKDIRKSIYDKYVARHLYRQGYRNVDWKEELP
jgi:hypothetical protein